MSRNPFFQNIEKKTGVNMQDLLKVAEAVQNANFKDEATVRSLVKQISTLANKNVSKETEDQIVQTIVNNKQAINMDTLAKMLDKK